MWKLLKSPSAQAWGPQVHRKSRRCKALTGWFSSSSYWKDCLPATYRILGSTTGNTSAPTPRTSDSIIAGSRLKAAWNHTMTAKLWHKRRGVGIEVALGSPTLVCAAMLATEAVVVCTTRIVAGTQRGFMVHTHGTRCQESKEYTAERLEEHQVTKGNSACEHGGGRGPLHTTGTGTHDVQWGAWGGRCHGLGRDVRYMRSRARRMGSSRGSSACKHRSAPSSVPAIL